MKNKQFTLEEQRVLEEIMTHRRDVRGNNFVKKDISNNDIEKILYAASLAPSVGYSQPWEFVIIREDKTKQHIAKSFNKENNKARQLFSEDKQKLYSKLKLEGITEAPVNIAVYYKSSSEPVLGQTSVEEVGEYSVVCAIQNMWLMSRAMNIGLGWVSILNPQTVNTILNSPPQNKLVAYLCIGYVKEFYESPELEKLNWEKRKPINSTVYHNAYSGHVVNI